MIPTSVHAARHMAAYRDALAFQLCAQCPSQVDVATDQLAIRIGRCKWG